MTTQAEREALEDWIERVNTLAALTVKQQRYAHAVRLKSDMRAAIARLSATPAPTRQLVSVSSIDVEQMIAACVPDGSVCDPQVVADEIRRYCNAWPEDVDTPAAEQRSNYCAECERLSRELDKALERATGEPHVAGWPLQSGIPPAAGEQAPEARLTKPALVGNGRFGVGVLERLVIEAAQRWHESEVTPEKEAKRIAEGSAALTKLRQEIGLEPKPTIEPASAVAWQAGAWSQPKTEVMVEGKAWFREDHPRVKAAGEQARPVARVMPAYGQPPWQVIFDAVSEAQIGKPVMWQPEEGDYYTGHKPVTMNLNSLNRICSMFAAAAPAPAPSAQPLTAEVERLSEVLRQIGDYAHDHSTGPAVPDALWEVRSMAYEAIKE